MGPESGKGCDNLAHGKVFYVHPCFCNQFIQTFPGGGCGLFVLNVNGCGPHNQVAMYCRRYQDALSILSRKGEYGMAHMISCALI